MASIAPSRRDYDRHGVSPLPRLGALLLVLLVTAAGIAPIIPWGDDSARIDSGGQARVEGQATAAEGAAAPGSSSDGIMPVPQINSGTPGAEAPPAAGTAPAEAPAAP